MSRPAASALAPLPKAPVLGWDSFWPPAGSGWPNVGQLPHRRYTSSGRAALFAALGQLRLPPGSGVLVPTYHCPTMIAPVVEAGLQPLYYPLDANGLPALERIETATASAARVMFVAHFFGLAHSLRQVLDWCRSRGIVLVEDCAHCYFGMAGERPAGHWGDYATASLSKFFPVSEGGLLASASRDLPPLALQAPGLRAQLKAVWDPVDLATRHGRLTGLSQCLRPLRTWRTANATPPQFEVSPAFDADTVRRDCDMARIGQASTWPARTIHRLMPTRRVVDRRRAGYSILSNLLSTAPGATPMVGDLPPDSVPYVLPLMVESLPRADAVYAQVRAARLPVFRWDRLWPGTPAIPDDHGALWSRGVLQLLCHQDLSDDDLRDVAMRVRTALAACTR